MSHGGGTCSHQHDCADHNCAADWSLYQQVDIPKVSALNAAREDSAQTVIKPWEERLDLSTAVESNEDDPELIISIPFTVDVKIKSISILGGADGTSPASMRAFVNREDIDFMTARDMHAVQEWELGENLHGELEYLTKYAKFQGVANLVLHFPTNMGGSCTRIHYIGLRGEATKNVRKPVTNVVYEAMARPQDHKVANENKLPEIL